MKYKINLLDKLLKKERHDRAQKLRGVIYSALSIGVLLLVLFQAALEVKSMVQIIDFEEACRYYNVFDLGMGVLGLCAEGTKVNLAKARALGIGYQKIQSLTEQEKECLQLFSEYAAIATAYWRFWKFNIHTPIAEKSDKHWEMAAIARNISAIPKARFMEAVFNSKP